MEKIDLYNLEYLATLDFKKAIEITPKWFFQYVFDRPYKYQKIFTAWSITMNNKFNPELKDEDEAITDFINILDYVFKNFIFTPKFFIEFGGIKSLENIPEDRVILKKIFEIASNIDSDTDKNFYKFQQSFIIYLWEDNISPITVRDFSENKKLKKFIVDLFKSVLKFYLENEVPEKLEKKEKDETQDQKEKEINLQEEKTTESFEHLDDSEFKLNFFNLDLPKSKKKDVKLHIAEDVKYNKRNKNIFKRNRIWYLKYDLFGDISLRYYYLFQDRPQYNNKWILKNHKTKRYQILDDEMAHEILEEYQTKFGKIKPIEIIGFRTHTNRYLKLVH